MKARNSTRFPVAQPTTRPLSGVGVPVAANTIRARSRIRGSLLVERLSASSVARSSIVSAITVAQGTVFIQSLNHGSWSEDSGY
jgi:hypothetical protein